MDSVYQICANISPKIVLRDMFGWPKNPAVTTCLLTTGKFIYCTVSYVRHCSMLISGCNVMAELSRVSWLMRGFLGFGKDSYLALFLYYSQTIKLCGTI